MYDYARLRGRIAEKGESAASLSAKLGISENAMYNKLLGYNEFKQSEMDAICRLLDISPMEISSYFFAQNLGIPK